MKIAMMCDFFYPNTGGVESHIYQVSQCLLLRGHRVIVITHMYDVDEKLPRVGIRWLPNRLKVYYLPFRHMYNQCMFPAVLPTAAICRNIFIREQIDIVHGHSSFSTIAHEGMAHARFLNIPTVFTDHSLFGFADVSSVVTNKLLEGSLEKAVHVICVSNTSKENTALRSDVPAEDVFVIPNALDPDQFYPFPSAINTLAESPIINIIVVSRLAYRKGADLLLAIVPHICTEFPNVNFIIAGDGPKLLDLQEMRDKNRLHERVEFLGFVPHDEVPGILNKGHIFLNMSLTESFCIAIVEAACVGLAVVSTKVGGIPEVLPPDIAELASPTIKDLCAALSKTVTRFMEGNIVDRQEQHNRVRKFYTWPDIAQRTECVYTSALAKHNPALSVFSRIPSLKAGGALMYALIFVNYLYLSLLSYLVPASSIERTPFP